MEYQSNGNQLKALAREMRRAERLADRLDRALGLADKELGVPDPGTDALANAAPRRPVPIPTPESGTPSPLSYRGNFESTFGISGTPITSGFLTDLGEYNPELMGRSAIHVYEQMRRGDAQVRATVSACKLPVQSAKWEVIPGDPSPGLRPPSPQGRG